jgi:hypothetical protein
LYHRGNVEQARFCLLAELRLVALHALSQLATKWQGGDPLLMLIFFLSANATSQSIAPLVNATGKLFSI